MKSLIVKYFPLTCLCAVLLAFWATDTSAYPTYEGGCVQCHPEFLGGQSGLLHGDHQTLTGDCTSCHLIIGDDPETGYTPTSDTGR